MMMKITNSRSRQRQPALLFFGLFAITLFLALTFTGLNVTAEGVKSYARSFKVSQESAMLSLSDPEGSIKVRAWDKPEIKVAAKLTEPTLEVSERQAGDTVQIDVHCSKAGAASFE